jgi:PLP dependent protein
MIKILCDLRVLMAVNKETYQQLKAEFDSKNITLVAVSKTKPVEDIQALYELGHRDFGENYVQELVEKAGRLPADIRWHFIGHLQSNKVKFILPFVHLIHGVDSFKLLKEINKQSQKLDKTTACLLQVHIAQEETKFGLDENELKELLHEFAALPGRYVNIHGLMGMASFTDNMDTVRAEFKKLKSTYDQLKTQDSKFITLSMGMSNDYKVAIEEGSNLVRIGSLLFGERVKV